MVGRWNFLLKWFLLWGHVHLWGGKHRRASMGGPSTAHLANKSFLSTNNLNCSESQPTLVWSCPQKTKTLDDAIISQHLIIYSMMKSNLYNHMLYIMYMCIMFSSHILKPSSQKKKTPPLLSSKGTPGNHIAGTPRSLEVPPQNLLQTNRSLQCLH